MSQRPQLSSVVVHRFKQTRIMEACASQVAENGYHGTHIGHLVKGAGIARKTFYDIFPGKRECFTATLEWVFDQAFEAVKEATGRYDSVDARIDASMEALVDFFEAHPRWAKCALVEAPAGAPELYEENLQRFAQLTGLPNPTGDLLVGGIAWILYRKAVGDEPEEDVLSGLRQFCHNTFDGVLIPV